MFHLPFQQPYPEIISVLCMCLAVIFLQVFARKQNSEVHLTNPADTLTGLFMCFGRLIGAATGLEVARGGDHESVED